MKALIAKLTGISTALLNFYLPILKQLLASGMAALLPYALEIVRSLAEVDKTGAQKREAAVKKLSMAASELGITATESLIRLTVESAVQKLKLEDN
jgi:vacuolar-type H+-ATPase subunit D/Vma8